MNNVLYVGHLPTTATEQELKRLFTQHGYAVRAIDFVRDGAEATAYVTLSPFANRHHAIKDIDGTRFAGKTLVAAAWPVHLQMRTG